MSAGPWPLVAFEEAAADMTGGHPKTPQTMYLPRGAFPIVDQGKDPIGGFTDDPAALSPVGPPVVVFGDHTKCVKYVDFPFGAGADGVKVLKARQGFDTLFLYHFMKTIRLPEAGYSRHFKYLREVKVPCPSIEEQRRIASILDAADALLSKRRQALEKLDSLAQSIFIDMFGEPGANPHGFATSPMIDIVDPQRPITYGILKPGDNFNGGVPYVRVVDMVDGSIGAASLKRTTPEISHQYRRSLLQKGDVLMSIRGHVGRLALVEADVAGANITQDTARLAITGANPTYLLECLRTASIQRWMSAFTKGAAVRGINLTDIKRLPIPLPPSEMQDRFAQAADEVRRQRAVHRAAASQSDALFSSLQHRAFQGEL